MPSQSRLSDAFIGSASKKGGSVPLAVNGAQGCVAFHPADEGLDEDRIDRPADRAMRGGGAVRRPAVRDLQVDRDREPEAEGDAHSVEHGGDEY